MDIIRLSHGETQQQHLVMMKGYSDRGKSIAAKRHVDPLVTDVKNVLDFLHGMYKQGCIGTVVFVQPEVHFLVL